MNHLSSDELTRIAINSSISKMNNTFQQFQNSIIVIDDNDDSHQSASTGNRHHNDICINKKSSNDKSPTIIKDGIHFRRNFEPRNIDVIVGKGMKNFAHSGNEKLRRIVASREQKYNMKNISRKERSDIISSIVNQIHNNGGYFVKKNANTGFWMEADDVLARDKISQAFRSVHKNKSKDNSCTITRAGYKNKMLSLPSSSSSFQPPKHAAMEVCDNHNNTSLLEMRQCNNNNNHDDDNDYSPLDISMHDNNNNGKENVIVMMESYKSSSSNDTIDDIIEKLSSSIPEQILKNQENCFEPIPISEAFQDSTKTVSTVMSGDDYSYLSDVLMDL